MSQLSPNARREGTGSSSAVSNTSVAAGSVSMTPPPPEPPQLAALGRRSQPFIYTAAAEGDDEDLGPSLTSAQLMRAPISDRHVPDLSVSNDALLASLQPAAENTLSLRASRLARGQSERALYWFGTRPSWLQATLSVAGGSIVGLSLVVAYAKTFHASPEPELTAEPTGPARGAALIAAAAPAALIAQSVVQPLAAAPAPARVAAPAPSTTVDTAVAAEDDEPAPADSAEASEEEPRKPGKRQRASKSAANGKLPAWVQQSVKPQVQRATAREKRAAAREKRAAALREKKARRSRAKREQE